MRKYLYLFFMLIISQYEYAQFFPDSNATWQVTGSNWNMSVMAQESRFNFFYEVGGDTVLNGLIYQKIHLNGVFHSNQWEYNNPPNPELVNLATYNFDLYFGGVREADSSVYFIDTNDVETMVMKYNVKGGDTLIGITPEQTHFSVCNGGYYNDTVIVETVIDEVLNGNNFRTVSCSGGSETYIQNIGKKGGLFWNLYPDVSNCFGFELANFCWENVSYSSLFNSQSPVVNYSSSCSFVGVEYQDFVGVDVFPIPASDRLSVEFESIKEVRYKITNLSGKVVKLGKLDVHSAWINTSDLQNGFYLLLIQDASNNIGIRKIEIIH